MIIQPSEAGQGNEDTHDASGNDHDTNADLNITTQIFSGTLAPLVISGDLPITFLANITANGTTVHDDGGNAVTSLGEVVKYHFVNSTTIEGLTNGEEGTRLIFTLHVNTDGTFTFTLNDQIDHPTHSVDNDSTNPSHTPGIFEETLNIDLSGAIDAHDANGDHPIFPQNTFDIGVIDDTPVAHDTVAGRCRGGAKTIQSRACVLDDENQASRQSGRPRRRWFWHDVSGVLDFSPGADNYGSVSFATNLAVSATERRQAPYRSISCRRSSSIRRRRSQGRRDAYLDAEWRWRRNADRIGRTENSVTDVFTLTVDKFGDYTFTAYASLSHPIPARTRATLAVTRSKTISISSSPTRQRMATATRPTRI